MAQDVVKSFFSGLNNSNPQPVSKTQGTSSSVVNSFFSNVTPLAKPEPVKIIKPEPKPSLIKKAVDFLVPPVISPLQEPVKPQKNTLDQISDFVGQKLNSVKLSSGTKATVKSMGENVQAGVERVKKGVKENPQKLNIFAQPIFTTYVKDVAKSAVSTIKGAGTLTPPYMVYRAATGDPINPKEYAKNIVSFGLEAMGLAWRLNPAAPVAGAVFGEWKGIRKFYEGKIEAGDIVSSAASGINDLPGLGEVLTDNIKLAEAIDITFLATMFVKPVLNKKLNMLNIKTEELNQVSKTLGVKPNSTMEKVSEALRKEMKKIPDAFTNTPSKESMARRVELTNAYNTFKKAGFIEKNYAAAFDFINGKLGKLTTTEPFKATPKLLGEKSGQETTVPSRSTSIKSPSDLVAGRTEPSGSLILTEKAAGLDKSTNQSLPSKRIDFIDKYITNKPLQSDYTTYYDDLQEVEPEFTKELQNISESVDGQFVKRLKNQESLNNKLIRKNQTQVRPLGDMNDTLAGTIVSEDINNAVSMAQKKGIKITTDYRETPTFLGYKGVHGELELSNGALTEVQFNTKEGLAQKKYAHTIYDKWRTFIEKNGETTYDEVFNSIGVEQQQEFIKDVQLSRDIYDGKVTVPEEYIKAVERDISKTTPLPSPAPVKTAPPASKEGVRPIVGEGSTKETISSIQNKVDKLIGYSSMGMHWKQEYFNRKLFIDEALQSAPPEVVAELSSLQDQIDNRRLERSAGAFSRPREQQDFLARTPSELKKSIDNLNKFGQQYAILRKTGGISNSKAVGEFARGKNVGKEGEVRLKGKYISEDKNYLSVLSHELGHAIEFNQTGGINKDTLKVFGDDLTTEIKGTITEELKEITKLLEGEKLVNESPNYYNKPTELLARYFEMYITNPQLAKEVAPTAWEHLEEMSVKKPMIADFLNTVGKEMEKDNVGFLAKHGLNAADRRQSYQKYLGKRVGNIAFDEEVVYRALLERGKISIEKFVKEKFKGVKDDPENLFRAAEGIKVSRGGVPEFGTRDFSTAHSKLEEDKLKAMDWKIEKEVIEDGKAYPMYAKQRYTPDEAKAIFDSLSPKGKQVILDFTAAKDEAKDYFNREVIKDVNKINSDIEGWVHHYFDEGQGGTTKQGLSFKTRKAGTKMRRFGVEGFVQDFKKSMTKALTDLESEKVFNDFVTRQFARVSKPIQEGATPDSGWVEVQGSLQKGIGSPQEKRTVVIQDGKKFVVKQTRYQVPKPIYERYKLYKGLVEEASTAMKIVNDINRYWRINVLSHPGTAVTNFISGGIQYSSKMLTDFYTETLSGKITYKKTRENVGSMLSTLLPKGWADAPDWVYGADLSNFYGQFTNKPGIVPKSIDAYADKTLKLFGLFERYWKKTISLSEGARELKGLEKMTKEGLRLPTEEERNLLGQLNREVDLYAYDYDNIPLWLENFGKGGGGLFKPFTTYPYKYGKMLTNMVGKVFDRQASWKERVSTLLMLGTMVAAYSKFSEDRKTKQQTPEGTENTPARLSPRGRIFVTTDSEGREIFVRTAKYPFINLTDAGMQMVNGNFESGTDILSDMLGSITPLASLSLLAIGYRNKYEMYDSVPVIIGNKLNSYMPLQRIFTDVSMALDPFQRKQTTFLQTFTKSIPTTDADLQNKLHGETRTERVPIEGDIKKPTQPFGSKKDTRTTIDVTLKNYSQDILFSLLTGIYLRRIDPDTAKAFLIREEKNDKEAVKKSK